MATRGHFTPFTGVRLPRLGGKASTIADPANGARVLRCRTCGQPDRPANHLTTYELRFEGRHAGAYVLCERDFNRANPPPLADPLDVSENA